MASYGVIVARKAEKQLRDIPLPWRERITQAINLLGENALYGKKMRGIYAGRRKMRVWPYRIYYRIEERRKLVSVLEVRHRGGSGYK